MENQRIQSILDTAYHKASTKIGNLLQAQHDTLNAEIRRTLTALVPAIRREVILEIQQQEKQATQETKDDENQDGSNAEEKKIA